jgi:nicotinamide-nucleotide amidase
MSADESINEIAEMLVSELVAAGKSVSTAESCTGGWIAKSLTDVSGSSSCFGYGIVSYSNGAKESMLGVQPRTLLEYGAVSEAVVREMAQGVLQLSGSDFAVAVSGIAGPDGGTEEKPVGTVWIGWAIRKGDNRGPAAERHALDGDRESIRSQTVILALQGIRERLRNSG